MKLTLIALSLLFSYTVYGGKNNSSTDEYTKAIQLLDSCKHYFDKDSIKYERFANQFNEIAFNELADTNFRKVIGERVDFLKRNFSYKEALPLLKKALALAEQQKDTVSMAYIHKWMSTHYFHLELIDSTSAELDQAFNLFDYLNNKAELGIIAIRKSRIAFNRGQFEEAIKNSYHAIELHKAAGDQAKMAISYLQLGNTYLYLSNHLGAWKYFELASILFKKTGNDYGYAEAISNTGLVEIKTKKYQEGIQKQRIALDYFKEEEYFIDMGITYHFMVEAYFGLKDYDSALYYNELAKEAFEKSNYQKGFCQAYLNEATVFYVKGKYDKALASALKCYEIAASQEHKKLLEEVNYELYRIYKKLNQETKSFHHLEKYVEVKDSLNFNPYALQSEAMKYQLAAEEAQLYREIAEERAQLEHERSIKTERQLINTIVIAILILISLFVAIYYLLKNRKLNKSLNAQRELLSEDIKTKESLLSEIHHRVKNNLQVINSMLSLQNQYVNDESLKKVIEDCKGRIISMSLIHESLYRKKDFKEALFSNYIKELLPKLISTYGTDPNNINLSMDVEPIKLSLDDSVPCGLLINEIVSNSLKHGFPEGKKGNIHIELKQLGEEVHLKVADDGIGLKEGETFKSDYSFGFLLIETLANQLGADLEINTINGFSYQIQWKNKVGNK